jgi:hypothetical protein
MNTELNDYISNRYNRWFDYASFHCTQAGIADQANDILNEVMISLLEKEEKKINCLFHAKKGKYRELDFFVLRMIKLNVYSPTSPYQNKYKVIPANTDIDYRKLNVIDSEEEEIDRPAILLAQFELVRETFEQLHLSCKAKQIFEHRFFHDLSFSEWDGPENKKQLYDTYTRVEKLIKKRIFGRSLL